VKLSEIQSLREWESSMRVDVVNGGNWGSAGITEINMYGTASKHVTQENTVLSWCRVAISTASHERGLHQVERVRSLAWQGGASRAAP
jgi:hypothetical protein